MSEISEKETGINKKTLHIFWSAFSLYPKRISLIPAYYVSVFAGSTMLPLYISQILSNVARGVPIDIIYSLFLLLFLALVAAVGNYVGFLAMIKTNIKAQEWLSQKVMKTLLNHSMKFHSNSYSGKLVGSAIDYPGSYARLTDTVLISFVPFLITVISGVIVTAWYSWQIGFGLVLIIAITLYLSYKDSSRRSHLRPRRRKVEDIVRAHLADSVTNVATVKAFGHERTEINTQANILTELAELRWKDWGASGRFGAIRMGALLLLQVLFVIFLVINVQQKPELLGIGIFAFTYTLTIINRLFDIGTFIRNIEETFVHTATMTEIISQYPDIVDMPHAKKIDISSGEVSFSEVTFSYLEGSQQQEVFEEMTLNIPAGQKVGLVGPSGGGKSTLTRLILRFDDIQSGSITIDKSNIAEVTQESLHDQIAYVPQEPLLFHRSIKDNIAYGRQDASNKEILRAAKQAHALEFIETLPNGFDTLVGERGVKLSGGQRQRVAIARAILKDAPILVLDEATSALDSESEHLIKDALKKLMKGRTSIVIAHRLSTISHLDRIVVLDKGKIIEQGTHKELLDNKHGTYARLWSHQSGGFLED